MSTTHTEAVYSRNSYDWKKRPKLCDSRWQRA